MLNNVAQRMPIPERRNPQQHHVGGIPSGWVISAQRDQNATATHSPQWRALGSPGPGGNAINGVPACANRWLLTDTLRSGWGFEGYTVSDCDGLAYVWRRHTQAPALSLPGAWWHDCSKRCMQGNSQVFNAFHISTLNYELCPYPQIVWHFLVEFNTEINVKDGFDAPRGTYTSL